MLGHQVNESSQVKYVPVNQENQHDNKDLISSSVSHQTQSIQQDKKISFVTHTKENEMIKEKISKTDENTKSLVETNIKPEMTKVKDILSTQLLGTLYLTLHKAKNLDDKDAIGKSDPFATIKYGDTRFKLPTKKNTCDPVWNFEVDFKIHEYYPKDIKIELFDKDKVGKDDPLGDATLNVQDIIDKTSITKSWTILNNSKKGEILYTAKFSPKEEKARKKSSVKTSHTVEVPSNTEGTIENILISHNIQLPEGFSVESINSEQT